MMLVSLILTLMLSGPLARANEGSGKEQERALSAANVLTEILNAPESIPRELLDRAQAIAVIPNVVKGAFGVGGRAGKGLVAKRKSNGAWGTPSFIDVSGGSFGLQIGVSVTDVVLVFTEPDGLKGLFEDKLELGGDAGVAAGPVGRSAEVGTNVTFDSPIYSYSRSKGLFAGIALKGTVMTVDDSANQAVYGKNVSGSDILLAGKVPAAPAVRPFVNALSKYVPPALEVAAHDNTRKASSGAEHQTKTDHQPEGAALSSAEIKKAQEALQAKGYYTGRIDGIIGPKTRQAIRDYQASEKIQVTGFLDAETASRLGVREESVGENFKGAGQEVGSG
jgi:lipid-binding SYLF domain-containing protein